MVVRKLVFYLIKVGLVVISLFIMGSKYCALYERSEQQNEVIQKQELIIKEQLNCLQSMEKQREELDQLLYKYPVWIPVESEISYYTIEPEEGSGTGITASGVCATVGRTIASNKYPFGTKIMIGGNIYTVEDRGSEIIDNCIDILVHSQEDAFNRGRHMATVYVLSEMGVQ